MVVVSGHCGGQPAITTVEATEAACEAGWLTLYNCVVV